MNKTLKTVLVVIAVLILLVGAFFLGQYVSKEVVKDDNNVAEKNDAVTNNKKDDNIKENVPEEQQKDIYEQVNEIKKDSTFTDLQKVNKIFSLINEYALIGYDEPVCQLTDDPIDSDDSNLIYGCLDKSDASDEFIAYSYYIDEDIKELAQLHLWIWDFNKNSESNLDSLRNYEYYNKYLDKLINTLSIDDIYSYMNKKYNISSNSGGVCIGYSYETGDDYFYLNFSHTKRSWYNLDKGTGICDSKVKDLVMYKFNIKTDKYEVIEK